MSKRFVFGMLLIAMHTIAYTQRPLVVKKINSTKIKVDGRYLTTGGRFSASSKIEWPNSSAFITYFDHRCHDTMTICAEEMKRHKAKCVKELEREKRRERNSRDLTENRHLITHGISSMQDSIYLIDTIALPIGQQYADGVRFIIAWSDDCGTREEPLSVSNGEIIIDKHLLGEYVGWRIYDIYEHDKAMGWKYLKYKGIYIYMLPENADIEE